MKKWILYGFWVVEFILCASLGFIHNANAVGKVVQTILSLLFFVPPAILLVDAIRKKERGELLRLIIISAVSLALTMVLLVANVLSVGATKAVGDALYGILIVVSSPMVCSRYWLLSLFLWACLLFATLQKSRPCQK